MKVKANSVTFPDGSRVGTLIVSPVTADKLPMAPPAGGAQFGVPAWTVQPAGTRFDPPIEVTLPNASSQPAGDNLPIVQWDHDLGQYVAMGRATVSEDGAVLVTDSGSGITKAGWGGLCRYDPDKCGKTAPPKCKNCEKIDSNAECPTCIFDKESTAEIKRQSMGGQWEFGLGKQDVSKIFSKIGLPKLDIKAKGQFQGAVTFKCCPRTEKEEKAWQVSALAELEASAEGPIPSLGFSLGVLEVGIFAKLKVAGAVNIASFKFDRCEGDTSSKILGSGSVALTGEIIAKIVEDGIPATEPYGMEFTGGASGGRTWIFGEPTTSFATVTAYGKGEVKFGSRKYQLINISKTWTDQSSSPSSSVAPDIESAIGATN